MATQTDAQITTAAGVIKNETTPLANTATRYGTILENIAENKINVDKISTSIATDTGSTIKVPTVAAVEAAIEAIGAAPKTYKAFLTQSSTAAPVATVVKNDIGTATWERTSAGIYTLTTSTLFTSGKTFVQNNLRLLPFSGSNFIQVFIEIVSTSVIRITTSVGANGAGTPTDGALAATDFDIIVYP